MADLVVFEPSPTRQKIVLEKLIPEGDVPELLQDFDVFLKRLENTQGGIALFDLDLLVGAEEERLISRLKFLREFHVLLAVSGQNEKQNLAFTLRTGIPVFPLYAPQSENLSEILEQARKQITNLSDRVHDQEMAFIGQDTSVKEVLQRVELIADTDATVLITGETGSGKTILAKLIHNRSFRRNAPFIHINCAAIPDQLLEAELFGYKKGAFTGANQDTMGKFKAAGRGTILLDEIGEMPVHLQAKLLKVLDEGRYYPIGGTQLESVAARIIAATNKNLFEEMAQKRFRRDLFYRLNTFEIHLPPLSERRDDIPLLFNYYLNIQAQKYHIPRPQVQFSVYEILRNYDWPGNVRELQNLVETLMYSRPEFITLEMLPKRFFSDFATRMVKMGEEFRSLDEIKRNYARFVLQQVEGNKTRAAKILGIDIKTFNKLIKV